MSLGTFRPWEHASHAKKAISEAEIPIDKKMEFAFETVRNHLRQNHSHLFAKALMSKEARAELQTEVEQFIKENPRIHIPTVDLEKLIVAIQNEIVYLGPIQEALDDPNIANIEINSPWDIYVEERGEEFYRPDLSFRDAEHLSRVIDKMLLPMGKSLTANEPHIDSQFEGFRICAVLGVDKGGISAHGSAISIRKFSPDILTDQQVVNSGTVNEEILEFFNASIPGGSNIIIGGSTNSGKTTTLVRLPLYLDENERIITIEDSEEMLLRHKTAYKNYKNIVSLVTKANVAKERRYDIAKLVGVSLRMRPFKIIIGEVRFSEAAKQAHEAMNTGHACYMTLHCSSARHAAIRIVQLAGDGYNDDVIAAQLADSVDLIFFQQKIKSQRFITEIVELIGYNGAKEPIVNPIFKWRKLGEKDGKVLGKHERVGSISSALAEKWRTYMIPEEKIRKWLTHPQKED